MALKVLFIGGCRRSGSTLLSRVFGNGDGFCDVGELKHIWKSSLGGDHPCSCGRDFRRCGFWTDVITEAFGGFDKVDLPRIRALKHATERPRKKPFPIGHFLRNTAYQRALRDYGEVLQRLLTAVQHVSACRVVVDSSKTPEHASALNTSPGIELHVIHLVRDARAMAHSWRRLKKHPGASGTVLNMPRLSYLESSRDWHSENRATALLRETAESYRLVRYEDFVRDPKANIARTLDDLDESGSAIAVPDSRVVELRPTHSVSGNPSRFDTGQVKIRLDDKWEREMSRWGKGVVTLSTLGMLRNYGYIGSR